VRIYAVGGAIRDQLLGLKIHDIDYVVVGATVKEMLTNGFRPVGKDFPVFLHPETQAEYALARTERKTASGHQGFLFYADPSVTLEEDLSRRDLTINAMAQAVDEAGNLMGEIIDPYGGKADLAAKQFRHVSQAFAEDPLRLIRVARFAARFSDFKIHPTTLLAMRAIVASGELQALSRERIWHELSRAWTSIAPLRFVEVLEEVDAANLIFPEAFLHVWNNQKQQDQLAFEIKNCKPDLESRCAVLLKALNPSSISQWSEHYKMPHEVRDFVLITADLFQTLSSDQITADIVLNFFNRADLWRKPERLKKIISLLSGLGYELGIWNTALNVVDSVNASALAEQVKQANQTNTNLGPLIHQAVEAARLKAIHQAMVGN
jgi:tRNA nucleotidyltransferase (CCA-adding enzyme)